MKKLLGISSLLFAGALCAATVEYDNKTTVIGADGTALEFKGTNECISPLYADWDGDGVKDLLCGYWKGQKGFVRFYKNEGTSAEPSYSSWEHIKNVDGEISALGG